MDRLAKKSKKKRFWEIDFLRGVCVMLMLLDHFMFSAGEVFPSFLAQFNVSFWQGLVDFSDYYWVNNVRTIVRFVVVGLFMVLCGVSCTLSRSNLKRGLKACACALLITIVTYLFSGMFGMNATILFGVIHMLGVSMLVYYVLQLPSLVLAHMLSGKALEEKKRFRALEFVFRLLPAAIGLIGLGLYFGLGLGEFVKIPNAYDSYYTQLVSNVVVEGSSGYKSFVSIFVELKNYIFVSADYFPVLPYAALVLFGGFVGEVFYRRRLGKPVGFVPKVLEPVGFVGRHAIIFYLVHQAVIAAFFFVAAFVASR